MGPLHFALILTDHAVTCRDRHVDGWMLGRIIGEVAGCTRTMSCNPRAGMVAGCLVQTRACDLLF